MDRTIDNPSWFFIDVSDDNRYGEVTEYVVQNPDSGISIRIGKSLGGHAMKCKEGYWQVDSEDTLTTGEKFNTKCFEHKLDAVDYAIGWVENL